MISEIDATTTNILQSLAWWIHGTFASEDALSSAYAKQWGTVDYQEVAVPKTWLDVFTASPSPIVRAMGHDVESDVTERLVNGGSPVLILTCPATRPTTQVMGDTSYKATVEVAVEIRCELYTADGTRTLDTIATRRQWVQARDLFQQLIRWNDGCFPIYRAEGLYPPHATEVGAARLQVAMSPVDRENIWATNFTLRALVEVLSEPMVAA